MLIIDNGLSFLLGFEQSIRDILNTILLLDLAFFKETVYNVGGFLFMIYIHFMICTTNRVIKDFIFSINNEGELLVYFLDLLNKQEVILLVDDIVHID